AGDACASAVPAPVVLARPRRPRAAAPRPYPPSSRPHLSFHHPLVLFFLCPETARAELRRASLLGSGHLRRIPSNHSSSTSPATFTTKPLAQPSLPAPGIADLAAAIAAVRPSSALLAVILAVLHPGVKLQAADAHPCRRLCQAALLGCHDVVEYELV
ncbi:unnamed protein product, partial [Urochloa humidicola]